MNKWLNKIICGDNVKVMSEMPDSCIDLIVTSPPYDNLRDYKGYSFDFESCAKQIYRILKDGGVCVWIVGDATINGSETGTSFKQALYFKEIGFNLHDTMIYETDKPPLSHNRYEQKFEYMFIFSKGPLSTFNPIQIPTSQGGKSNKWSTFRQEGKEVQPLHGIGKVGENKVKGNVWFVDSGFSKSTTDRIAFEHPAIFPEKLAQDHIISWSNEGDIVLDPFNGSGTTCKMAYRQRRKYIGIDISKEYCEIAEQRLRDERAQLNLFDT
jgi:site-specific DNA-methyltransferase (adenine-specific)